MMKKKPILHLRTLAVVVLALALGPAQVGSLEPSLIPAGDCCLLPGDVNHDGTFDIADLTYYVSYMFLGGAAPICLPEADLNYDCQLDIGDLTEWICWAFLFDCIVDPQCHSCP